MFIHVRCSVCGKNLQIPERYAGQTGSCNGCGSRVLVPNSSEATSPPVLTATTVYSNPIDDIAPREERRYATIQHESDWTERAKNIGIASCAGCIILPVLGFTFLMFVGLLAGSTGKSTTTPSAVPATGWPTSASVSNDITLAQFNQLRDGMSYSEVVGIFGREGVIQSQNTLPNGLGGQLTTVMYSWENSGFSSCSVMFQNDSLMMKSQFGLR